MKLRNAVFGAALGLAVANAAHAGISAGIESQGQPQGELFLTVWDPVNQVSYTRDLGIDVLTTDFASATFTFSPDANWDVAFDGSNPADLRYSIVGSNNDLVNALVLGVWTTSNSPTVDIPINEFSALNTITQNVFAYTLGVNEAAGSLSPAADVSGVILDTGDPGYYGNAFTFNGTLGSIAAFNTGAPVGTALAFYSLVISNDTGGELGVTPFPGTWALDADGNLAYSTAVDTDGDGVTDDVDNCTLVPNANQIDADADGFGNLCDADLNNDCITNPIDLGIFRSVFFGADPVADLNSDGVVNPVDLGIFRSLFFQPPGPNASGTCP